VSEKTGRAHDKLVEPHCVFMYIRGGLCGIKTNNFMNALFLKIFKDFQKSHSPPEREVGGE